MNKRKENALDDFLDDHPDGCEVSFNYGWEAAVREHKRQAIRKSIIERGGSSGPANSRWNPEITEKYEAAKALIVKGYTRAEACRKVDLFYDSFMRRQRMEMKALLEGREP